MIRKEMSAEDRSARLYYEDSHIGRFYAQVKDCTAMDGRFGIVLDRTAFFPEGGGQYGDTGRLLLCENPPMKKGREIRIVDTVEKEGHIIHLSAKPVEPGTQVEGQIDMAVRFDRMQQHTAEHIVSGIICRRWNCQNVGFHLGEDVSTMDFDADLSKEELALAERLANAAVWADLAVEQKFPSPDELQRMEYRSKIDMAEDVRLIQIPGVDLCACCAPHVSRTGEVGMIRLVAGQRYKGGTRVSMLAGGRALGHSVEMDGQIGQITRLLSVPAKDTAGGVEKLLQKMKDMQAQLDKVQLQLAQARAALWKDEMAVILFEQEMNERYMRDFMNELQSTGVRLCALFAGTEGAGYRFVIGLKEGCSDELAAELRSRFHAKCGGRDKMIRGSVVCDRQSIELFLRGFAADRGADAVSPAAPEKENGEVAS